MIPEESDPPPEIAATKRYVAEAATAANWTDAVLDSELNAMLAAFAPPRDSQPGTLRAHRNTLVERALADGPDALSAHEKNIILADRAALRRLHDRAWTLPSIHADWLAAREARRSVQQ